MQPHHVLQTILINSLLLSSHYGLTSASPLFRRQTSSCTDLNAPFDSSCYSSLNLSDFLTNPQHGWNATRGKLCQSGDNAAYCCRASDPSWSACFIRQSVDMAGKPSCDITNTTTCPITNLKVVPEVDSTNQRKVQYVLHNIYSINTLFTSWQSALIAATTNGTKTDIQDLVSEIDPKGIVSSSQPSVIQAYLLGLPALGDPNAASLIAQISNPVSASAHALLAGLQNAPTVADALFYNKTATNYPVQTTGVTDFLAGERATGILSGFINKGLSVIMSDMTAFANFTSTGAFSGTADLTIDNDDGLDVALQSLLSATVRKQPTYRDLVERLNLGITIP